MPKLSVLMPARNAEPYVSAAIRSVLVGLPRDADVWVLDDASTDGTLAIVESIRDRDPRLKVISSGDNLGVAEALNSLLEESDSEIVARMDADDLMSKRRLHVQMRDLDRVDAVFSPGFWMSAAGRLKGVQFCSKLDSEAIALRLLLGNFLVHGSLTCRRSVFHDVGGYRHVAAEDYDLWIRMLVSGKRLHLGRTPHLRVRRHAARTVLAPEWQLRRASDAESEALFSEYEALARLCLRVEDVPRAWFEAAMRGGVPPKALEDLERMISAKLGDLALEERLSVRRALSVAMNGAQ